MTGPSGSGSRRAEAAAAALAIFAAALWMTEALVHMGSARDLSFPEGDIALRAAEAGSGRLPYHDWREWPHAFSPYGPLAYAVPGFAARIAGSVHPLKAQAAGRLLSLAALAASAALIFLWVRRAGVPAGWALAAAAAALPRPDSAPTLLSCRPDAPQALLALGALFLLARPSIRPVRAVAAGAFLAASAGFKPSGIGEAAAGLILAFRAGGWAGAACFAGTLAGLAAAATAILEAASGGAFLLNTASSAVDGLDPLQPFRFAAAMTPPVPLAMAAATAAGWLALTRSAGGREPAVKLSPEAAARFGLLAAAAFIVPAAWLLCLKRGASVNYFAAAWPAACGALAAAFGAARAPGRSNSPRARRLASAAGPVLAAVWAAWTAIEAAGAPGRHRAARSQWSVPPLAAALARADIPVLTAYPFLAIRRPAPPVVMDLYKYSIFVRSGRLSAAPLAERIEAGKFALIVLPADPGSGAVPPWLPDEIRKAIERSCGPPRIDGGAAFFEPRPSRPEV